MLNLKFYRLYFVLYVYSLIFLLACGITWDTYEIINNTSFGLQFRRTATALLVLICSYSALVFQHMTIEKVVNIEDLRLNKYLWFEKNMNSKTRKAKFFKTRVFIAIHIGIFLIVVLPLLLGEITKTVYPGIAKYIYSQEFAIVGVFLRTGLWIPTTIVGNLLFIRTKPRILELY